MNSSLWYFPISALVNALTSLFFGVYLLTTNQNKRRDVRLLACLCFMFAIWSLPYFIWQQADTAESALFWSHVLMVGAIMVPMLYFHFVLAYLQVDKKSFYKKVLIVFYSLCAVWEIANFNPYFISHVEARSYFKFWPMPGFLYAPFLICFFSQFIFASYLLWKNFKRTTGVAHIQGGLLLLGIVIAILGGSTNYFLWYNIPIAPWGNGLGIFYIILTVYGILKYRFMDVRVVFAELFTGSLMVIFVVDIFLSKTFLEMIFKLFVLALLSIFGILLIRSQRREVERMEELHATNLRLQDLDHQKNEFLSIAAHQLRTPLSILNGYLELIQDEAFGNKETEESLQALKNMDESNSRLTNLVNEFLDIARIEAGRTEFKFEKGDLITLISSVVLEVGPRAIEKKLRLVWNPVGTLTGTFDTDKIRHVILNFVDNAIKYSSHGTITITVVAEEGGLCFRVTDQGIGFEETDRVNLFQKLFRGKNVEGTNVTGTGIGLYVCAKFIEAHGGRVLAKSPGLGRGSEFGFWIPLQPPSSSGAK